MGLFDFLKRKNTSNEEPIYAGIEDSKFNSQQFQHEICALALWKLEENNGNPSIAINELKKIGLNDIQVELILKRVNQFKVTEKQNNLTQKGIDESIFNSDNFQKEILDNSFELYFKSKHSYEAVKLKLNNDGLSDNQTNEIISKLKIRISEMVDDFQDELDSGVISEIKIMPNIEHVKGNVDSEQVDKYIAYGAFQMERDALDNALELFDKAIELDDKAVLAYANKGTLFSKKGENEKALQFYSKALEIEPNHVKILENKMDLLYEMMNESNEKEFINIVNSILKNDPNHPNALIYIIQFFLKENDIENALISVKKLFANYHGENIAIHLFLDIFHKLPQDRALNEFEIYKTSLNDAAKYQLHYCKGLYLKGVEKYNEAIVEFEQMNQIQEFSWSYYQMAIIKNLQDKIDEALELLRTTFRLEAELKNDAKQYTELQNLWTNPTFIEITR